MAKHPSIDPRTIAHGRTHRRTCWKACASSRRQLSPVWFYDELGSFLFDNICELPEYYLTRTELQIMRAHAAEMAHHIGPDAALIEFGSGTSMKTRLLLDQLEKPAAYVPVDISRDHLLDSGERARARLSDAAHRSRSARTSRGRSICRVSVYAARRRVVYFPGSTLGNFDQPQAHALLQRMRQIIGTNGAVLIGIDLQARIRAFSSARTTIAPASRRSSTSTPCGT